MPERRSDRLKPDPFHPYTAAFMAAVDAADAAHRRRWAALGEPDEISLPADDLAVVIRRPSPRSAPHLRALAADLTDRRARSRAAAARPYYVELSHS